MVPHVTEPRELVNVPKQHVVAAIFLLCAVMEIFSRETHVKAKARHELANAILGRYERVNVVGLQSSAAFAHENVIDVDKNHSIETNT